MRMLGCASIPPLDPSIAMYCGNRSLDLLTHGSLELAEGLITAGRCYVIKHSLIGLLAVAVHLIMDVPIEDSQSHLNVTMSFLSLSPDFPLLHHR
jgi:hypothetical protein